MLQPKDRAKLRGLASTAPDLVYVGQNGVTNTVIEQVKDNLLAHELVKIKVQKGAMDTVKDIADQLMKQTESEIVCVIGSKIVLYKYSNKSKIHHVL